MIYIHAAFAADWQLYHKVTFDGIAKQIIVNEGVTALDIRADVYSAWIEWQAMTGRGNTRFFRAMRYTGLDIIPGGFSGDSYFLINGWKLLVDITKVKVTGVLFSDDYDTPYYQPDLTAVYPATVAALVNTVSNSVNVVTGDISSISVPTSSQNAAAVRSELTPELTAIDNMGVTTAAAVGSRIVEGTFTMDEVMRLVASALAGKVSGAGTSAITFRDLGDTKNRIVATVDANGNRTAVTKNVTP